MTSIQVRLLEYGAILLAVAMGYLAFHHHVYKEGFNSCVAKQTIAIEKGDKKYEAEIPKNHKRSDASLRKSVCLGVYDTDYDTCVKSLPDFSK